MRSQPHAKNPNPGHQGQEEEPAEHLLEKLVETLPARNRRESARIPGTLLKGQCTGALKHSPKALVEPRGIQKPSEIQVAWFWKGIWRVG